MSPSKKWNVCDGNFDVLVITWFRSKRMRKSPSTRLPYSRLRFFCQRRCGTSLHNKANDRGLVIDRGSCRNRNDCTLTPLLNPWIFISTVNLDAFRMRAVASTTRSLLNPMSSFAVTKPLLAYMWTIHIWEKIQWVWFYVLLRPHRTAVQDGISDHSIHRWCTIFVKESIIPAFDHVATE